MKFTTIIFHSLLFCSTILNKNSVMSGRMSTNNGDVISIMIPEDPDNNLNIDQLTLDFRRQLGRLIQQSRINKLKANHFRYAPSDKTLLKQKKLLKSHRQNLNRYSISKFDRKVDNRGNNKQGKKPLTYRSNLLRLSQLKSRSEVLKNKRKLRHNKWRHVNNFNCGKKDFVCRNKFFDNVIKSNRSSSDVIGVENNSRDNNENLFGFNNRKQKLQSSKILMNDKENVGFSNLQNRDSIPDCSRKIDENGKEYILCFNGSAIDSPEKMMETFKNDNDFYNKEKNVNNNPSLNDVKSQEKVYPINIQVNNYEEIEKILQNPETALKHINSFGMEKNFKLNINDINSKKSRDVQIDDNSEKNPTIKSMNLNIQQAKVNDYSEDPVNNYESNNKRRYDSINNQDQFSKELRQVDYQRNTSQVYFDNENFPLRASRSISNNPFSKTPIIHIQQHRNKLIKHKLILKEKFGLLKKIKKKTINHNNVI